MIYDFEQKSNSLLFIYNVLYNVLENLSEIVKDTGSIIKDTFHK